VLDQHNAVHIIPQRQAETTRNELTRHWLRIEAARLAHYEAATCRAFNQVVTVTEADRLALSKLSDAVESQPRFKVIPICVDPQTVTPLADLTEQPEVLFVGGMHWPPNRAGVEWFARNVWPAVCSQSPAARLSLVGRNPPPGLDRGLGRLDAPGYIVDLDKYWRRSRVFIVPLWAGGGMRVKILEAWAYGLPVVSTTIGAEGLDCWPGENILLADEPEEFARAVLSVLKDSDLARRLAAAGRQTIETQYNWRIRYQDWDAVYADLIQSAAS
jgi:glycosyltransferase involved in cell wall biosynthesis